MFVDADQITQVLIELLTNSRAAYDAYPLARIEAGMDDISGDVVVRVVDNGHGMDAATLDNAFTPFFSSLTAGRRRGMGLSKARRLVQLAGGKIWMNSTPGEGTTVCFQVPPAEEQADSDKAGEATR